MKLCVVQNRAVPGNIEQNVADHVTWIRAAVRSGASTVFFPELSLTSYEPRLAEQLATDFQDSRLDKLQQVSDSLGVVIGAGLPTKSPSRPRISMVIFQPGLPRQVYSKQLLHADELDFFSEGSEQLLLSIGGHQVAPAICYESMQPQHCLQASESGAEIYIASVAKPQSRVEKAFAVLPQVAARHSMPVLMSNSVGPSGEFQSAGQSSVWNETGALVGRLGAQAEGLLTYDTDTGDCSHSASAFGTVEVEP